MIKVRTLESRGNAITPFTGAQVSLAWTPAAGLVCLAAAKRGNDNSPSQAALATLKRSPASLCEHLRSDKSQSAAFICPQSLWVRPLPCWQNVGVAYG